MKYSIIYLFGTLVFLCAGCGSTDKGTDAVAQAVETLRVGMIRADEPLLNKLISESLTYGHSNGVVESKDEFVAALVSGKYNFLSIRLTDQNIIVVGDVAAVRHRLCAEIEDAGNPRMSIDLHVLTVWHRKSDSWMLLARQAVSM